MTSTHSDALVLFGVTGDLAHKMIFPALYALEKRGALKTSASEHQELHENSGKPSKNPPLLGDGF